MSTHSMWQRLYKVPGKPEVLAELSDHYDDLILHTSDEIMKEYDLVWLCPKPQKVTIDLDKLKSVYA